jgi:hypothetical protein
VVLQIRAKRFTIGPVAAFYIGPSLRPVYPSCVISLRCFSPSAAMPI